MDLEVILYYANIVDYVRLALLVISVFMDDVYFLSLYMVSVSLDFFDGMLADKYDQSSKLGACLDMIIDRVSTMVILYKIAMRKPSYQKACIIYSLVDVLSHFLFFVAAIYKNTHHKIPDNYLMSVYYRPNFLKVMCVGSEVSFIMSYYMKRDNIFLRLVQSIATVKTFFHVVHFVYGVGSLSEVKLDEKLE